MPDTIRLLIVEDSVADTELMIRVLQRDGLHLLTRRVEDESSLTFALDLEDWDIIISDFRLPHFGGAEALKLVRMRATDLPFVLVSGTIGEEKAAEIIRSGANDYLLKDNLSRLPSIIRREIRDARLRVEHRDTLKKLQESHQEVWNIVQTVPDVLWTAALPDKNGEVQVTFISPSAQNVYGLDPISFYQNSRLWIEVIVPEDRDAIIAMFELCMRQKKSCSATYRIQTLKGELKWLEDVMSPRMDEMGRMVGTQGVVRDITARKKLEAEKQEQETLLRQAQKLEAVGILAAGFAHDFNNVLAGISLFSESILSSSKPSEPHHEDAMRIFEAVQRGSAIVTHLLAFSKKKSVNKRDFNLSNVVEGLSGMLNSTLGARIHLDLKLESEPLPIHADFNQIEQIILNLVINAKDAISEEGSISIRTFSRNYTETLRLPTGNLQPGKYACLQVKDTGIGMDEQTISHIFEPFFTTKEVGKGTGLGLAMVYGIALENNGHIQVASRPREGTTFTLLLPLAE